MLSFVLAADDFWEHLTHICSNADQSEFEFSEI